MGWYESFKDAISIAQKADNIELYRLLLDIQKDALDLFEENKNLKDEIKNIKNNIELEKNFQKIEGKTYYIFQDGKYKRYICSNCWDNKQKIISINLGTNGSYECNVCKNHGVYDQEKYDKSNILRQATLSKY